MTALTKEQEQYIEQEVKIRLHDEKFQIIERDFNEIKMSIDHLDNKLVASINHLDNKLESSIRNLDNKLESSIRNLDSKLEISIKNLDVKFDNQFKWIMGMFVSSIVIPVILHFVKAV
jgi:predicted PurR-regulated permease PerM